MIDEDFRAFLQTLLPAQTTDLGGVNLAATPIEKGKVSATQPGTRVFFQRADANHDVDLAGNGLLYETLFDVECGAIEDDKTAQVLAQALKEGPNASTHGVNAFRGTMGTGPGTYVHGAFAQDHSDDYEPKLLDADEGYSIASFRVQVIHETP